jgi:predicted PurR-regulated permease PerM
MSDSAELPPPDTPPPAERRAWFPNAQSPVSGHATRGQRAALVVGLLVVLWLALQLFASVLAPFVAAAGIAYVLDPPTSRLTRLGISRGIASLAMILALLAAVLLFALLLYPLILQQVGLLLGRIPQYVQLLQRWASTVLTDLQQNFGSDVVNDKLRDLVSSQAGNMLSFIASSLTSVTGAGFAIFNVLSLAVVTPVVGFYLLRDWPRVVATGGITALGLAMAQFPQWRGVIVVGGVLVVGQILEGYVIYPRFLGDRVELPAVWVIFALFAGGAAFGFLGVMLAVPVAATIGVLCRFWLRRYLASPLYLDPPGER